MKKILLTDEEIQALANLMDAGVRHQGLSAVKNAAALLQKLETAEPAEETENQHPEYGGVRELKTEAQ